MMVILRRAASRFAGCLMFAGVFIFTLTGCGEFTQNAPPSNGSGPAMVVDVALSKGIFKTGPAGGGALFAAQITSITCTVTADDMETVTVSIPVDTLRGTLTVPVGEARTFTVTVDTANDGSFSDSQTLDIKPNSPVDLFFSFGIYTVAGRVSGLHSWMIVQNNGGDDLTITENGTFEFDASLADGSGYDVTILIMSSGQISTVTNASGTLSGNNVTDIEIACVSQNYAVGGAVGGLGGTLVLQNNGADDLTLTLDGFFTFSSSIEDLLVYDVTVLTQPVGQTCTVTNASGNITDAAVTDVTVTCVDNAHTVGGAVSGLTGSGLVLQNSGGDDLTITGDGSFSFASALADGSSYNVTVSTQPSGQGCVVTNGSGTISGADIANINVACSAGFYTVGGSVSGLTGTGLVLQNSGGYDLTITGDGSFTFASALINGSAYDVTVLTQPTAPSQTCTVTNSSGTVASAAVTDIAVTCSVNTYTVGGSASGLGAAVVLQNNGGDDLTLAANGTFTFATAIADGSSYNVTVLTQPVAQTCAVANGSGTISAGNVTSVTLTCTDNLYGVGGSVSGLTSWLILQNSGGDDLTVTSNGTFSFATALVNGSSYNVTVLTQPTGQTCAVANGSGTILTADVTNITVTCTDNFYTVGGAASGLSAIVVLRNNGGDDLTLTANGNFTFATALVNGSSYNVTILSQKPYFDESALESVQGQTCTVTNGSGTINAADITDVTVTCSSTQK